MKIVENQMSSTRKSWVAPQVKRIDAGSAENGAVNVRDGSTTPGTAQS